VFEWGTVWLLFQQDGLVSKEDMRRCYDVCFAPFSVSGLVASEPNKPMTAAGVNILRDQRAKAVW
jgi:hypothetical protein